MYRCIFTRKESLHHKSLMGLKILWSWRSRFFFSKSQQVGRFLIFQTKLHVLPLFFLFLSKKGQVFVEGQHRKFQNSQMCDFGIFDEKVGFIFILRSDFLKIKRKFKPPFTHTLPISQILQPPYTPRRSIIIT